MDIKMETVLLLLGIFGKMNALPFGAPILACTSMLPFHGGGIPRQIIPSPFEVIGNFTDQGFNTFNVSIKSSAEVPFEGVMLQARLSNGSIGGTFEPLDNLVYTINCQQQGDTITHISPLRTSLLKVRWVPPTGYQGSVIFNATVVQNYSTFWTGVQSKSLNISGGVQTDNYRNSSDLSQSSSLYHNVSKDTANKSDPLYEGCSTTKLCFGVPNNCVQQKNCKAVTAIAVKGNQYEFEIKAAGNPAWVGVGLSENALMGDDSVIECVKTENSVKAYLSWTIGRPIFDVNRTQNSQEGIELNNFSSEDGVLYCRVLRDAKTSINGRDFDLANNKFHILIAAGTAVEKNKVAFHDILYKASSDSSFLSEIPKTFDK